MANTSCVGVDLGARVSSHEAQPSLGSLRSKQEFLPLMNDKPSNPTTKGKKVWFPVPLIVIVENHLAKKAPDLESLAIIIQVWGDTINLSKMHHKFQDKCFGILYFLVISASSLIIVFDSVDARARALENSFFLVQKEPNFFKNMETLLCALFS